MRAPPQNEDPHADRNDKAQTEHAADDENTQKCRRQERRYSFDGETRGAVGIAGVTVLAAGAAVVCVRRDSAVCVACTSDAAVEAGRPTTW